MNRPQGIDFCKEYFGFTEDDVIYMSKDGKKLLTYLWESGQLYESKWNILRQEIWQQTDFRGIRNINPVSNYSMLDVGCGVAEFWRPHIESGQHVYLYDTSKLVLEYLNEKYKGTSAIICDNIDSLYPVDRLFCLDVLEHVRDPISMTRSLKPRLKKGGKGLFYFDRSWPHPGHLLESIDQFKFWLIMLPKIFDDVFVYEEYPGFAKVTR